LALKILEMGWGKDVRVTHFVGSVRICHREETSIDDKRCVFVDGDGVGELYVLFHLCFGCLGHKKVGDVHYDASESIGRRRTFLKWAK